MEETLSNMAREDLTTTQSPRMKEQKGELSEEEKALEFSTTNKK